MVLSRHPVDYEITVVDADTFTLTDINSGTIANDPACYYVHSNTGNIPARWMTTNHTAANDTYFNGWMLPENGLIARNRCLRTGRELGLHKRVLQLG